MKKNKYVTESFINAITKEVSILIAANDHMSIEKAENLFKESKVYNFLCFHRIIFMKKIHNISMKCMKT